MTGARTAQAQLATALAANPQTTAFPVPAPIATCVLADASGCALTASTVFARAVPSPAASACPQSTCTIVLQENSAVTEARAAYAITTVITAPSGATVATRSDVVAFRTFGVPPYATPVGGADGTVDALIDAGPGDDAGAAASLITVEYDSGAIKVPGNVWNAATENAAITTPAWDR